MTEAELNSHPWYKWLERRFGDTVAARIINETHTHAIKLHV